MLDPRLKLSLNNLVGAPSKPGDVGVELECEGEYLPPEIAGWVIKAEGSLRGKGGRVVGVELDYDLPREYVSARPYTLRGLSEKLDALDRALRVDKKTVVRLTPRASTHIHVNFGQKTLHDLLGFVLAFMCVEPVLLRLCGPDRNGNLFCLPTYEAGDWPEVIGRISKSPSRHHWPRERKYSSLNIDPVVALGSVEVRCFPNSVTPSQVLTWAQWLLNLRALAENADDTFEGMLERIATEPNRFLTQVFDTTNLREPCYPTHPAELVQFGLEQAYEVWRAMAPLFDFTEAKEELELDPEAQAEPVHDEWDGPPQRRPRVDRVAAAFPHTFTRVLRGV